MDPLQPKSCLWLVMARPVPPPREPGMTPQQHVLCACLCFVFVLVGFYACLLINAAVLNQALDENAALRQENADLRAAYGLPAPAPLARN